MVQINLHVFRLKLLRLKIYRKNRNGFVPKSVILKKLNSIKILLRQQKLHTVCEEAACPNLPQCFGGGTATFMIMGDICTRRCPFCDVAHGRPNILDPDEPRHLAETVKNLNLKYVVITSVDRDDLKDGGAQHFVTVFKKFAKPAQKP